MQAAQIPNAHCQLPNACFYRLSSTPMDTARGKTLDDAPGVIGITRDELPPLPDSILTDRSAGRLNPRSWFVHPDRPLEIEVGCGKGGFILQHALAHPEINLLGIEIAREFYVYTADRLRRRGVTNVRMMCADASEFLTWRCPDELAHTIHLYYSDPWPKNKHHKNRVVQHAFLSQAWRVLRSGGELRVVTDHDELWAWCEERFAAWTAPGTPDVPEPLRITLDSGGAPFERLAFTPPTWVDEGETVGTNYERKFTGAAAEGKQPHACVLRKTTV